MVPKITNKTNETRTRLVIAAMTLLLAITVPAFTQGQEQASTHEMKVPETAKDHHEMAEHYQKVAAQTREDVVMHKKMLADFNKGVAANPKSGENPYAKQMRQHCEKYTRSAQILATEADASANFHTLRAKELEGK